MAKKTIHHMDFDTLVAVNREVVLLTGELHEFTAADGEKLKELLAEVEGRANDEKFEDAVPQKAALLVFKIASGQHFRSGNKRTALVAGSVFLRKNGHRIDIKNDGFVSAVDKVGIAAESLDNLQEVMDDLVTKSASERKSWETAIKETVEANKKFLTDIGS